MTHNALLPEITSYYIDENDTMHTYIGEAKHVTISCVTSDEMAEELIEEINKTLNVF